MVSNRSTKKIKIFLRDGIILIIEALRVELGSGIYNSARLNCVLLKRWAWIFYDINDFLSFYLPLHKHLTNPWIDEPVR
jgi:hypothetical protein